MFELLQAVAKRSLCATCVLLASHVVAASPLTPTQALTNTLDAVAEVMSDEALSVQAKQARVVSLLYTRFDFEDTGRRVLATRWKQATQAERTEFVELLSQLVTRAYWRRVLKYRHGEVQYLDEHRSKDVFAKVNTVVVNGKSQIPIDYSLKQRGGDWLAYDVRIEGVSMVGKLRDDYLGVVKEGGISALLEHLKQQLEEER